jgi:hypothetical protein
MKIVLSSKFTNFKSIFFFFIIFLFSLHPTTDPDLGWHLATGRYISQTKTIPTKDPFSYSLPNHNYTAHSWLSDLALYYTYSYTGFLGISLLFTTIQTFAIYYNLPISKLNLTHLPPIIILLITINLVVGFRTQLFSFALLISAINLIYHQKTKWLIPIFILWANLHGGFLYGLIITSFYTLFTKNLKLNKKIILILTLTLCTTINPYFIKPHILGLQMSTNNTSKQHNLDWMSPLSNKMTNLGKITTTLTLIITIISIILPPTTLHQTTPTLILTVMSLTSVRYLLPLLAINFFHTSKKLSKIYKTQTKAPPTIIIIFILFFPIISLQTIYSTSTLSNPTNYTPKQTIFFPHKATQFIKNNPQLVGTNIFNPYNWGGYLIWNLPNHKFFIDGRMDNFYSNRESFLKEYLSIHNTEVGWEQKLNKYNTNSILVETNSHLSTKLESSPEWELVYKDNISKIYTHIKLKLSTSIKPTHHFW